MSSPRSVKQILEQLQQLQEKLPAALYDKVGNVFLGGSYKIAKAQGAKIPKGATVAEPNTEWESDLDAALARWVNVSEDDTARFFKKNKPLLDKLKKEFPQLLQPPIGQPVYRGTVIKLDSLKNAFLKKKFIVVKLGSKEMFYFKNLDYSPNRGVQSWTLDPKVAFNFQGRGGRPETDVPVVYATKVNSDFVFNPLLLQIIWGSDEKETMRVAGKGTFSAYVDPIAITNTWNLSVKNNFIHLLPSAKPFFNDMVERFNAKVDEYNEDRNKKFPNAYNVKDVFELAKDETKVPFYFDLDTAYTNAARAYVKSLKK